MQESRFWLEVCEARYQIHNEHTYGPKLFLTELAQDSWEAEKRFFSGGVFGKDTWLYNFTCTKFTENTLLDANRKKPKPNKQQKSTAGNNKKQAKIALKEQIEIWKLNP